MRLAPATAALNSNWIKDSGHPMGTILVYRNDGFCEIALDDGHRVQLRLSKQGLIIERQELRGRPSEVLFEGNVATVAGICSALMDQANVRKVAPLDLLVSVVTQLPSAEHVQSAFRAASQSF